MTTATLAAALLDWLEAQTWASFSTVEIAANARHATTAEVAAALHRLHAAGRLDYHREHGAIRWEAPNAARYAAAI
jgi:hypothetical protein